MRPIRQGPGVVLVFGESLNDSRSVRELVLAANHQLLPDRVKALPKPMSLTREAKPGAVERWVDQLERAVRAHQARERVVAMVVHRDADGPDPRGTVETALAIQVHRIGGLPVVPVQAIEAWWFLLPDAVEAVRPSAWRGRLPRSPRDVELINQPKAELRRATRAGHGLEYTEADSPVIASHIREKGLQPLRSCASYDRMVARAQQIR